LYQDHVIFAKDEIVKADGKPYTVFTPYSKKWLAKFDGSTLPEYPVRRGTGNFLKQPPAQIPTLDSIGFQQASHGVFPPATISNNLIENYANTRDYPTLETSKLGVHLRFGTISTRELVRVAEQGSHVFLNELIWREFFQQILWHFPTVTEQSFKRKYDQIEWRNVEAEFDAWCNGMTGYPLVDAGMRELNATGFMHNRVRMVTASFLVKHLLVDWRWGEAYFAEKLLDFELASNNGNWQWAAGTGCDAAPYFRIFNPASQAKKFDPKSTYIKAWIPEVETSDYPQPIVDHSHARKRALETYARVAQLSIESTRPFQ
jgi:deoxyribodipyrimidine photo-lyase